MTPLLHDIILDVSLGTLIWAQGLVLLAFVGIALGWATARAAVRSGPLALLIWRPGETLLQVAYRIVIAIVSLYYYSALLLLPAWMVVVGTVGIRLYQTRGYVSLMLLLACGYLGDMLYTALAVMGHRVARREPGRPLRREQSPVLFAHCDAVASRLGVEPVTNIYVTPGAELGVMHRGSLWQELRGMGERCLVLGLAGLRGMTQAELSAALAHEHAHLQERSMIGGRLSWRVTEQLVAGMDLVENRGLARHLNPFWAAMTTYWIILLRVRMGEMRLQELIADRMAAAMGIDEACSAITTHAQNVVIHSHDMAQFRERMALTDPARPNLYTLPLDKDPSLESSLLEITTREPGPLDSHPTVAERTRLLRRLRLTGPAYGSQEPAWTLIEDCETLQVEMTRVLLAIHGAELLAEQNTARPERAKPTANLVGIRQTSQ